MWYIGKAGQNIGQLIDSDLTCKGGPNEPQCRTGYETANLPKSYLFPEQGWIARLRIDFCLRKKRGRSALFFRSFQGTAMRMPILITLPDQSTRQFPGPVTVREIAASIGTGLAKAALAGKVDGRLVDLSFVIHADSNVAVVTDRDTEGLEIIRHSTTHLLAYAVKELFPEAQVTIGPVIENGFYYDFSYKRPFTPEDLAAIEMKMAELAKRDLQVQRKIVPRDEAVAFFNGIGEKYKAEIIASIPSDEDVSLYSEGDFTDLCRGPHVPSTGKLKVFKLMKVAGAYWRGDSKNEMLQRIYGTAWAKQAIGLVSFARRSSRHGFLASQRLGTLATSRAIHAQGLSGQWIPGNSMSANS